MIWKFLKQNALFPRGLNWVQHGVGRIGLFVAYSTFNITCTCSYSAGSGPWWPFFPRAGNSTTCAVGCSVLSFRRLRTRLGQSITAFFLNRNLCWSEKKYMDTPKRWSIFLRALNSTDVTLKRARSKEKSFHFPPCLKFDTSLLCC